VGRSANMRLYNANTATLLASLRAGADGYSGIAANYVPKLYAWLCAHHSTHPAVAERLHAFLTVADPLISARYPAAAKTFLRRGGMKISDKCRSSQPAFAEEHLLMLEALRREADDWHRELGLADPRPRPKPPRSRPPSA
jgi:4-hydroxy-tetrahydrodipicolinate synthase